MAYEGQGKAFAITQRAASAIQMYQAVTNAFVAGSQLDDSVIPGASGAPILGVTRASHAQGDSTEVLTFGVVKMVAGASIGAGAILCVGSLGLIALVNGLTGSAANGAIGRSLVNAAAGDVFAVHLNPGYF